MFRRKNGFPQTIPTVNRNAVLTRLLKNIVTRSTTFHLRSKKVNEFFFVQKTFFPQGSSRDTTNAVLINVTQEGRFFLLKVRRIVKKKSFQKLFLPESVRLDTWRAGSTTLPKGFIQSPKKFAQYPKKMNK